MSEVGLDSRGGSQRAAAGFLPDVAVVGRPGRPGSLTAEGVEDGEGVIVMGRPDSLLTLLDGVVLVCWVRGILPVLNTEKHNHVKRQL